MSRLHGLDILVHETLKVIFSPFLLYFLLSLCTKYYRTKVNDMVFKISGAKMLDFYNFKD